jgi:hypothetical protein
VKNEHEVNEIQFPDHARTASLLYSILDPPRTQSIRPHSAINEITSLCHLT